MATCEYCRATEYVQPDGRCLSSVNCVTRVREFVANLTLQLETSKAEVRACCGDLHALDPYLPQGWSLSESQFGVWMKLTENATLSVHFSGNWTVYRHKGKDGTFIGSGETLSGPEHGGILAAMARAEAVLERISK